MRTLLFLILASISTLVLSASHHSVPGGAGFPSDEHQPGHNYKCAIDAFGARADTAAGYGRCKMIYPLNASPNGETVSDLRVRFYSPDKSHNVLVKIYKSNGATSTLVDAWDLSSTNSYAKWSEEVLVFESTVGDGTVLAEVEVTGDTQISTVAHEVIDF